MWKGRVWTERSALERALLPTLSPHVQNYNFSGLAKLQLVSPRGLDFGTQRQLSSRHRYRIGKSARWVHVVPSASSEMPRPRPPPASARRRHPPPPAPCARSTAARPCRPAASSDTTPQKSTQKSKVASAGDPKVDRSPALAKLGVDLTKFAQTRCTHPAPNRPLAARRAPMRPRQRPQGGGGGRAAVCKVHGASHGRGRRLRGLLRQWIDGDGEAASPPTQTQAH